ncbi:molybdopterin biosynthesis protein MoeB [bacterium]|nr:molybdopterin biosynthesis protein MoeB [bacterium]MBU1883533.1 molybdopterin biosynthesis protein MoeB [bacterium]
MFYTEGANHIFKYGKKSYVKAMEAASTCKEFALDKDEDEFVTSVEQSSCYNCLYRRWSVESFTCKQRRFK